MLYMNLSADYRSAREDGGSFTGYSGIIVCVEDSGAVSDALKEAMISSRVPLFVIGQGTLPCVTEEYTYEKGTIVVRCDTGDEGSSGDILVRGDGLTLLTGDTEALGGLVFVGEKEYPLCQRLGNITHFAYLDASKPIMRTALASALQKWMWPYENAPTSYGQYIVLDSVYPFDDPARLMEITDALDNVGIPYALSVMPIYANASYPTMKRFCEYLRYVQSKGVGILLHTPLVRLSEVEVDELRMQIDIAYEAYSGYGVYPLAIQASENYLFSEKGLQALAGFRTVFLFESDDALGEATLTGNIAYRDGHQIVAAAYSDSTAFTSAYPQALYVDSHLDVETILTMVKRLNTTKRTFKSLSQMNTSIYIGSDHIVRQTDGLYANGNQVDLTYRPFTYEENYSYDRGIVRYLTDQIETSNQLILVFVVIACAAFVIMIVLSRRLTRRHLILGAKKKHGKSHNEKTNDQGVSVP
ncbi:MAG: DUF2334 domain-containing protein [Eubacteriales bacterium]|nr:DUF2334 domain-containing protein [Eubacteriales bacterium]